jgi:hypothetical protein
VPVVELDAEHPVAEGFDDLSLQLELLFLLFPGDGRLLPLR